jgi:hypothetical protein
MDTNWHPFFRQVLVQFPSEDWVILADALHAVGCRTLAGAKALPSNALPHVPEALRHNFLTAVAEAEIQGTQCSDLLYIERVFPVLLLSFSYCLRPCVEQEINSCQLTCQMTPF